MNNEIKKIAILTSGGDAPGMNAAIRAVAKSAHQQNIEPYLVYQGYYGLVNDEIKICNFKQSDNSLFKGGTAIYSARFKEFEQKKYQLIAVENLKKRGIQALVVIGGDGSYRGAQALSKLGVKTIALPGTIDNDISSTDFTIGFATAINTITKCIKKVRDTARSHQRIIIVEVMGHGSGDLALYAGIATNPIIISTQERKKTNDEIVNAIIEARKKDVDSNIVLVSEFLYDLPKLANYITEKTKLTSRYVAIGHIQRGGSPNPFDRVLATMMGIKAIKALLNGETSKCLGFRNGKIKTFDIENALSIPRKSIGDLVDEINKLNQPI